MKFTWYRKKVLTGKFNNYYSKISSGYTFLSEEGNDTWIGFLSAFPVDGCLEITDVEDLMKIQRHKEASNWYPRPMELKN